MTTRDTIIKYLRENAVDFIFVGAALLGLLWGLPQLNGEVLRAILVLFVVGSFAQRFNVTASLLLMLTFGLLSVTVQNIGMVWFAMCIGAVTRQHIDHLIATNFFQRLQMARQRLVVG